jgi:hypothetical protein
MVELGCEATNWFLPQKCFLLVADHVPSDLIGRAPLSHGSKVPIDCNYSCNTHLSYQYMSISATRDSSS